MGDRRPRTQQQAKHDFLPRLVCSFEISAQRNQFRFSMRKKESRLNAVWEGGENLHLQFWQADARYQFTQGKKNACFTKKNSTETNKKLGGKTKRKFTFATWHWVANWFLKVSMTSYRWPLLKSKGITSCVCKQIVWYPSVQGLEYVSTLPHLIRCNSTLISTPSIVALYGRCVVVRGKYRGTLSTKRKGRKKIMRTESTVYVHLLWKTGRFEIM